MKIREYQSADCKEITQLFYHTIHNVNAKDYTKAQLDAWAPGAIDMERFDRSLSRNFAVVMVENGVIIGFGDMDETGYLDRLFVHKDYQRKGVAKGIVSVLEAYATARHVALITTHASITAQSFFKSFGYQVIKEQQVELRGETLTNYVMGKNLAECNTNDIDRDIE